VVVEKNVQITERFFDNRYKGLLVGESALPHVVEEIRRMAGEHHELVLCPINTSKKSNSVFDNSSIFGYKKLQAPNNKLQTMTKFQAPITQTNFNLRP